MIDIKTPDFKKILDTNVKNLEKDTKKAFYRAVNKGLRKFRTDLGTEIRQTYTKVKKSDVTKATKLTFASMSNLTGEVKIKGGMLPIQDGMLRTKKQTKKGTIKVNIKDNATKTLKTRGNKPFIMTINTSGGKKTIVAQRKTGAKYPIRQIKTLSIPQMASNVKISKTVTEKIEKLVEKEFDRLLNFKGGKF